MQSNINLYEKPTWILRIIFLLMFATLLSVSSPAFADGMVAYYDPYEDRFDYADETGQNALISYENGLEKMILSIGINQEHPEGMVWIFPVPAEPDDVVLDIFKDFPSLYGEEISQKAKMRLEEIRQVTHASQIYTIPFLALFDSNGSSDYHRSLGENLSLGDIIGHKQDVVVHEHIEKEGVTSELITARTANGIYDYLNEKGLLIDEGGIPALQTYIGQSYSFVVSWLGESSTPLTEEEIRSSIGFYFDHENVFPDLTAYLSEWSQAHPEYPERHFTSSTWINDPERQAFANEIVRVVMEDPSLMPREIVFNQLDMYQNRERAVFVTFPTDKIYYPLIPTSVYDSKVVPATIRVIGHVTPESFGNIAAYMTTEYFVDGRLHSPDPPDSFMSGDTNKIEFTEITLNAPSKYFTEDLWMTPGAPFKVKLGTFIASNVTITGILIMVLSSIIAAIFAGMIALKSYRKNIGALILLGLSNCLSIIGLIIATGLLRTKTLFEEKDDLIDEIRAKGYIKMRRVAAILFVICGPILFYGLFLLPTLAGGYMEFSIPAILLIYVLPSIGLAKAFDFSTVRNEDRHLFQQLKRKGLSFWLLHPNEGGKIIFVPLFSFSFLLISWTLVKLIEFSV